MVEAFESSYAIRPLTPHERRAAPRRPLPPAVTVCVRIGRPDGAASVHHVGPHDVSAAGVSLWLERFVYEGAPVEFHAADGSGDALTGVCVRCGHLRDRLHEVAVRFDGPIDVAEFLRRYVTPRATVA